MRVSWTPLYPGLHQDSMTLVTSEWASLSFSLLSKPGTRGEWRNCDLLAFRFLCPGNSPWDKEVCVCSVCVGGVSIFSGLFKPFL